MDSSPPEASPPAGESPASPLAGLPTRRGDVRAYLRTVPILSATSARDFREPGGTELVAFERAFRRLLDGVDAQGVEQLASLGYGLTVFEHDGGGTWLLVEEQAPRRGWGTFVVNLAPARNLWLETPHADSDEGTLRQGAEQVVALGARALLVNGVHRCAASAASPCDGNTRACGGRLRVSDSAHTPHSFFTAAHRALRAAYPDAVAVNLHGMEAQGAEAAVISDGTRQLRPSSLSLRLRDALNPLLEGPARAFSCNDAADKGRFRPLCGTTNIQGRIDNGASDACYAQAPSARDRFLHLEQGPALRHMEEGEGSPPAPVTQALAETIPCSLPGPGLACTPSLARAL